MQLKTFTETKTRERKEITITFKIKPMFIVIDDDQDPDSNLNCKDKTKIPKYLPRNKNQRLGKRVIYFNKIENIKCPSENFDPLLFKLSLTSQA